MERGKLIVIEGIDGSGKDTIAQRIEEYLKTLGVDVVVTKEPGDAFGGRIRDILLEEDIDAYTELFLFLADRRRHVLETIKPALERGRWVVAVRFADSSLAYQGAKGVDGGLIERLNRLATDGLVPDLVVLLDIPVEEAVNRLKLRGRMDRFENGEFLREVRRKYLSIADRQNVIVVDAAKDVDEVWEQIKPAIDRLLGELADVPDELFHGYAVSTVLKAVGAGMHASLLVGPWNCCERLTIREIVKKLLPNISVDETSPIGVSHYDLRVVVGEKPQDIKIDQIREIEDFVDYRPVSGYYKVIVVLGVENMTQEAANALLKTLEEPPEWVVFLLYTSAIHMVLPTIISRSLVLRLHRFPSSVIRRWLIQKVGLDPGEVDKILPLLDGCPTRLEYARKMLEHEGVLDKVVGAKFHNFNRDMAPMFWEDGPIWDRLLFEAVEGVGAKISPQRVLRLLEILGGLKRRVQKKLVSDVLYLLLHEEG